jgi:SAM-dependent methyltransferase
MTNTQSSAQALRQIFADSWITQGIWVAAELGIADLLMNGPLTAEELAAQTQTHSGALSRVLRALASVGIFAQDPEGRFSLTPHADLLRSDAAGSQRSMGIMMGAEFYEAWGELLHSVRTGEPGFQKRFGTHFFQYMMKHPLRHGIYDTAMGNFGRGEAEAMVHAYDFSPFQTVVDVGGGSGLLLDAILNHHPGVQGILFDLPAVADRAKNIISSSGLPARCRIEGGDFFSSVPAGADAYVLQHIIHDWEDREAVAILRNCRDAMKADGRILLVEMVIPNGNEPSFGKWLDLMMLLVGGRERTEEEYRRLFSMAGLKLNRIIPTAGEVSILEGIRAS